MRFSSSKLVMGLVIGLCASACQKNESENNYPELPNDLSSGTFKVTLQHDGMEREAVVFVPESYDSTADTPLVLNFHGFEGIARYHMEDGDLRPQAESTGALLVYGQGSELDGAPHWNPSPLGGDNKSSVDDFGYIQAVLDEIQTSYPFNASRVSAVGFSNGGMMALGMACYHSELIASAGSVSGAMLDFGCDLSHPLSVITVHGTNDITIPYDNEDGRGDYNSATDVVDYWREENGTGGTEPVEFNDNGTTIQHFAFEGGTAGTAVHHYRVVKGEHVWLQFEANGRASNDIIWDFLTAYSVEGRIAD